VTQATKDTDGLKERECLLCGVVETKIIPATGTGDNAETGDAFVESLWITVMVIGMAGVTVLLTVRKRFTV
jgi:multisubunit Na+/H+ antiporter MnhC subunit